MVGFDKGTFFSLAGVDGAIGSAKRIPGLALRRAERWQCQKPAPRVGLGLSGAMHPAYSECGLTSSMRGTASRVRLITGSDRKDLSEPTHGLASSRGSSSVLGPRGRGPLVRTPRSQGCPSPSPPPPPGRPGRGADWLRASESRNPVATSAMWPWRSRGAGARSSREPRSLCAVPERRCPDGQERACTEAGIDTPCPSAADAEHVPVPCRDREFATLGRFVEPGSANRPRQSPGGASHASRG